ncbi:hypothetical protein M5K25_011530 [Dendrobium thyrsiflorum]|uniref:Uncharacterized protein n=1 Tax=Dendrobium thyrsiflorum TaxID=117978 RepID=A0ABD0V9Y7_DENTH
MLNAFPNSKIKDRLVFLLAKNCRNICPNTCLASCHLSLQTEREAESCRDHRPLVVLFKHQASSSLIGILWLTLSSVSSQMYRFSNQMNKSSKISRPANSINVGNTP